MLTRIITPRNPTGKYIKRQYYVLDTLAPKLYDLGFNPVIFDAIQSEEVSINNGDFVFMGHKLKHKEGCLGNFLSNFKLWKECVEKGEQLMILEDDAELKDENAETICHAIEDWNPYRDDSILYLLSQVPYLQGSMKSYPANLEPVRGFLCKAPTWWHDFSGTAAYCVNPRSAEALIHLAEEIEITPTDDFLRKAINQHRIKCLLPKEYKKAFTLHPKLYWG